jgi:ribosome-dependent ATPase
MGLLASAFTRSQIAAMFVTMIGTLIPAIQFSGLIEPGVLARRRGRASSADLPGHHIS